MEYDWLTELPQYLNKWGVTWQGYGDWEHHAAYLPPTRQYTPIGLLNHHTASTNWYPVYKLVNKCNIYVDPAGMAHLISLGYQADSGMGDPNQLDRIEHHRPIVQPQDYTADDRINGNPWFVDIEVGHPGDGSPIPAVQRETLLRCNAAICDMLRFDPDTALLGHKEWTRRKIDPRWSFMGVPDTMEQIRHDTVKILESELMPRILFEGMIDALFAADGEFQGDPNYWKNLIDDPTNSEWDDFWAAFTRMVSAS